ncbi:MAG: response regulator [Proteobacteria bacterium]|nr:response regulator [Pseudomonadota bacterium]
MIVEDNRQSRKLMKEMLKDYGKSDVAVDGSEAVAAFKHAHLENTPYDVIFLDIMMPGLDGHEVLREIREWEKGNVEGRKEVNIVMVTARSDNDTIISSY